MKCIFLMVSFLMISCVHGDEQDVQVNRLFAHLAHVIEHKFEVKVIGTGGAMMEGISQICLETKTTKVLSVEEARALIIAMAAEFSNQLKNHKSLHKFLTTFPADLNLIKIGLGSSSLNCKDYPPPAISLVSLDTGILTYYERGDQTIELIFEETYEEALKKLTNKKD